MRVLKALAGTALIGTLLFAINSNVFAQSIATIKENSVNIREFPSLDANIIGVLGSGSNIVVSGIEGDFFSIEVEGYEKVYVSSLFAELQNTEAFVNADYVNVRGIPSTEGQIIGTLNSGDEVLVLSQTDEWYIIDYNNSNAYVHKTLLNGTLLPYIKQSQDEFKAIGQAQDAYVVVNSTNGLNLREEPTQDSAIISVLPYGEVADVLEDWGEWTKVNFNGQIGFVNRAFVDLVFGERPSPKQLQSSKAQEIISYAKNFLGTRYRYGGTSLTSGVDCSGFTYSVMSNFGVRLNRTSRDQFNNGTKVKRSDLQMGDLVFFNTGGNSRISHVGLYIEDGKFIHSASTNSRGVIISSLNENYYARTYVGATRVINSY